MYPTAERRIVGCARARRARQSAYVVGVVGFRLARPAERNGSQAEGWRIGSGSSIEPVPGGVVLLAAELLVSPAGARIVAEK